MTQEKVLCFPASFVISLQPMDFVLVAVLSMLLVNFQIMPYAETAAQSEN